MEFPGQAPAIDEERLLETVGADRLLLAEICGLFLEDIGGVMERVESSLAARDGARLWRSAHAVKGSVSNFAADRAVGLAKELEDAAEAGEWATAALLAAALSSEVERVTNSLRAYL